MDKSDLDGAIADYTSALELNPEDRAGRLQPGPGRAEPGQSRRRPGRLRPGPRGRSEDRHGLLQPGPDQGTEERPQRLHRGQHEGARVRPLQRPGLLQPWASRSRPRATSTPRPTTCANSASWRPRTFTPTTPTFISGSSTTSRITRRRPTRSWRAASNRAGTPSRPSCRRRSPTSCSIT